MQLGGPAHGGGRHDQGPLEPESGPQEGIDQAREALRRIPGQRHEGRVSELAAVQGRPTLEVAFGGRRIEEEIVAPEVVRAGGRPDHPMAVANLDPSLETGEQEVGADAKRSDLDGRPSDRH